jgi:hypothetical protein
MTTAINDGHFEEYSVPEHQLVRVAHLGLEGLAVWIRGAGGVLVLDTALHILQRITSSFLPKVIDLRYWSRGLKIAASDILEECEYHHQKESIMARP